MLRSGRLVPPEICKFGSQGHDGGRGYGSSSGELRLTRVPQVNVPKTRRTYCKGKDCRKHTQHKVTQYKAGKVQRTALLSDLHLTRTGVAVRARKASLRSQTIRLWWSNEARVPQEGEDYEEGRVKIGVHNLQDEGTTGVEAMQAFRTWVCPPSRIRDCGWRRRRG